jgi:hypothetical protein
MDSSSEEGGTFLYSTKCILMGHNYPNFPIFGIVMMVLFCIPLGVIFQFLYFKSKSILIPAVAHGVVNWTAGNFIMYIVTDPGYNKLLYGPTGIVGISIFWIVAYYIFKRMDWVNENPLKPSIDQAISEYSEIKYSSLGVLKTNL